MAAVARDDGGAAACSCGHGGAMTEAKLDANPDLDKHDSSLDLNERRWKGG
ncbi:uncharacterized protein J3R85_001184 [Psidium guajava]|nr:uncharacterized protein J3R85_001184 [Psidium guajava]